MTDFLDQIIGKYHFTGKLGEGGMAVVYKGWDPVLERAVAVKVIRKGAFGEEVLHRVLSRFTVEAKALAKLNHPNIVRVIDYGEVDGTPYLVMEYLEGGTLKQYLAEKGRLDWRKAAKLLLPIAEALAYAHEQKLIHRDIKPSNILLSAKGRAVLTDFGIAKVMDDGITQDLTGTTAMVGTPEYMAPEQVTSKGVDGRADVYALGVVYYEMITGKKPYEADTPMGVLLKQMTEKIPSPRAVVPDIPEEVEGMLRQAMAKKPEDRYQDMQQFAEDLKILADPKSPLSLIQNKPPREIEEDELFSPGEENDFEETREMPANFGQKGPVPGKRKSAQMVLSLLGFLLIAVVIFAFTGFGRQTFSPLFSTRTPTLPPSLTPTITFTLAPTLAFTPTFTPMPTLTPSPIWTRTATPTKTPYVTEAPPMLMLTVISYACKSQYVLIDNVMVFQILPGETKTIQIRQGQHNIQACSVAKDCSKSVLETHFRDFTWYVPAGDTCR